MSRNIATGFEQSIIKSWDGWDGDHECMQFYDAELAIDIEGVGKAGDIVGTVCFFLPMSRFSIHCGNNEIFNSKFNITLE